MNENGRSPVHGPEDDQAHRNGGRPAADPIAPASTEPVELPPATTEPPRFALTFTVDGDAWLAMPAGSGAYGTGHSGLAALDAIHFAHASAPAVPLFEALLASGRFDTLYESELVALFRSARKIVLPEPGTAPRAARFRRGEGLS